MTQDMKKDTILHTGKETYVRRLINICSSAYEHMFIGSWTYVLEQAKQIVRPECTMSPLRANSSSLRDALTQGRLLCADEITSRSSRDYGSCSTRLRFVVFLLLMVTLGVGTTWGQDYSGTYFIASDGEARAVNNKNTVEVYAYGEDTPATNYYLVPASEPAQTNGNDAYFDGITGEKPFLTTYKTGLANEAIWVVTKVTDNDGTFYYIKHAETGKYVIFEKFFSDNNWRRKCLHLDGTTASEAGKFIISYDTSNKYYNIKPKNPINKDGNVETSFIFCNVSDKNRASRHGVDVSTYYGGLIGLWSSGTEANSKWKFEKAVCATPTISFDNTTNEVTISTSTVGATIYYTMGDDPADPTTAADGHDGTGTTSVTFSISGPTKIKAIAVKQYWVGSAVSPTKVISQVAQPVIEDNGAQAISITCETEGATIYYTTDGTTPPSRSSLVYSTPLTDVSSKTIKAIAVKDQFIDSEESSKYVVFHCAKPVINRVGNTFTITCSIPADANIFYTIGDGELSTQYGGAVSFTDSDLPFTVRAIAKRTDYEDSEISSKYFGVNLTGGGTSDNPYLIQNAQDFEVFVDLLNEDSEERDKYFKIEKTNDNNGLLNVGDCSAINSDVVFTGTLDGGMVTLSGLRHSLFSTVSTGATIKNVILDNVSISGGTNVGAICCEATGDCRIYNCGILATSSTVKKDEDGYDYIYSCSSTISGSGNVGGIVGLLDGSSRVINCFSYANVSGGSYVGGIVGYNNVETTASNLQTMVMNCMFYGEVSGGSIAPIYNGEIITNDGDYNGVNNFNYFRLESSYIQNTGITKVYNCALGAETRFLQRFEFFRHLLNSNRELAAWWATGDADNKDEMMKWVLEPSQIGTTIPYPILKTPDKYASVVNYTPSDVAFDNTETNRNKGRKLTSEGDGGVLHVTIQMGSATKFSVPSGAGFKSGVTGSFDLIITDKDYEHFNFNYGKVQLPYYNDYCVGNYTENRVVTGWKIVSITGTGSGTTSYSTGADVTYNATGELTKTPYNFADRKCTGKDLYGTSGRVFNQGAYWDVPKGVTAITIEPYWGKAVYLSDASWDVVYKNGTGNGTGAGTAYDAMTTAADVPNVGGGNGKHYENGKKYDLATHSLDETNGQIVYTSMSNAIASSALFSQSVTNPTVYDYAVVLVGNYHHTAAIEANKNYTVTSVDLDGDNEPDYSLMLRFNGRLAFHPVRYDFLNLMGLGMAQKTTGGKGSYNFGIMQPKAWFEVTNTALFRVTQFEYSKSRTKSPYILQGGVIEQWVTQQDNAGDGVSYFHIGGNVWFKEFHRGSHQDNKDKSTPHPPLSVTGGDFAKFYLTGYYQSQAAIYDDNAECYINGGRFGEVAGAGMEGIGTSDGKGNITWIIDNADIKEFYGGGINHAKPVHGNIHTIISNSHVDVFCGGPKFGDMEDGCTVKTTATDCTFGIYFGAGYGGNSYSRDAPRNHNNIVNFPHNDSSAGNDTSWNGWLSKNYKQNYDEGKGGISTQFDYQFLPMSSNTDNVARIFVEYVAFSLATTHDVTSSLTGCTITGNFYGGGSLGKVEGDVTSTLTNCTVNGSVFGAGYSASLPTVEVMDIGFRTEPYYYEDLGTYRKGVFPTPTTTYRWEQGSAISIDKTNHILYTTADLTALGTVTGKAKLTIDGYTTLTDGKVMSVAESVYGGGEESGVGDTEVIVYAGTIGTENQGGAEYGNVYGGGKGKYKEKKIVDGVETEVELDPNKAVILGLVKGNTNVTINGGSILHNVYGGGAYGSVGNFIFSNTDGSITGYTEKTDDNNTVVETGTANVTILGGTIGTTGKENGMVFGSSRGDVGEKDAIHDKLAWVRNSHVVIGGSNSDPQIKGSVYGSGENGHTYQNTIVDIHSGTIGINNNETVTYKDDADDKEKVTYTGKDYNYPYRGNVYGGGCGTDMYDSDNDGTEDTYNPLAGIVLGATQVNMDGGLVVHNIYGAGAMGSVGTTDNTGAIASGGTTTIAISGGIVGVDGEENGNVFGAARGDASASKDLAIVNTTGVTISGSADIKGSVYGGGEVGNVGTYTTDADDNNNYPEGSGVCNVSITGGTVRHHVFGAGKGLGVTFKCEKAMVSSASVNMSAGTVHGNVYGGGEVGRVEHNTLVTIGTESGGETLTINGSVFGAGKGLETHGYSALVRGNPTVIVQGSANVGKSVYGGGEIASVGKYGLDAKKMPSILKGGGECLVTVKGGAHIGTDGEGDVFGAGRGVETPFTLGESKRMTMYTNSTDFPAGATTWEYYETGSPFVWEYFQDEPSYSKYLETLALATAPTVNIEGSASINGSVYGGGEKGITKGAVVVNIKGGTIEKDVYGGGALADTNTGNWSPNKYVAATLPGDASETLYTRTGEAEPYVYTVVDPNDVDESGTYYKTIGAWTDATGTAWKTTTVNLTGGLIKGDAYGGGLGQIARAEDAEHNITALDDIKAYVWGDVTVKLNEAKTATDVGCSVRRIFGCNNQNGTPKGKVKVYVSATQNKDKEKIGTDKDDAHLHTGAEVLAEGESSTYDVAAVYGGGNLSPYEPADNNERTEVYIDGCKLTSIKQVYGGGNAACAPATLVHVTGAYEIEELFGGGNGYDDYELYGKYYKNPGANVGYRNYSVLDNTGDGSQGSPYGCKDADGTSTLDGRRSYAYGSGIATTEIIGGKIHFVYGGSNKKGNIRFRAKSVYEELDVTCPIVTDETYGGGKDSPMDGMVDMGLGCVNNMEQTFGGSKNADVNSDIYLRITNGTYKQVFGGNNTSGAINGSITVEIKEEGCSPVRIEELYLGGYLAPYSVYGYETENGSYKTEPVPYIDADGNQQQLDQRIPKTSGDRKKDPRIYVISATRIDNIFGGGYQAKVVGNPHVNVNMEKGKIKAQYVDANFANEHSDSRPYYAWTGESVDETSGDGILPIGTIGNIYGGGNMANIIGNTHVEIGTGYWHNEDDVLETETIGEDGKSYTYIYSESTKKWSCEVTTGEEGNQTTQTVTSDKAPVPARNAATITGNVYGGGKGKADTFECEKAMVGENNSGEGSTSIVIGNGKVERHVDDNGKVIGGNVYGGGEVGRVEKNTTVTIGLDPDEVTLTSEPVIEGDVFGAGAGVETHGYSALVRGDASVIVQASAQVKGNVYGGGEKATVGKYWVKGIPPYDVEGRPAEPGDLPAEMPYAPRAGGICTVIVKDNAKIGNGTTGGHVFGAGKGVEPHYSYVEGDMENNSKRMATHKDYNATTKEGHDPYYEHKKWDYYPGDNRFVWEYFPDDSEDVPEATRKTGEEKYATFLETLALASETHVTIGEETGSENVTVNGSVYGGSENGFVQTDTDVDILSTSVIGTNVFGGGKGTENHDAAGRVKGNSNVDISGGAIAGNVYGGGELGHVGTFTEDADGNYIMQEIHYIGKEDKQPTGLCTVTITGGMVGPEGNEDTEKGNVFGAGKGKDDTFKCEKAMSMETNVSVSAGTVNGNVYGGGEIGRVEYDTKVKIGSGEGTGGTTYSPIIAGSVFGAGRGVATHGYSALVRNNTEVTVEGDAKVGKNVYGGGEIASVGKYGLDEFQMPSILKGGGECTVLIQGHAKIGPDAGGNVFGAGKGVDPHYYYVVGDMENNSKRMATHKDYNPTTKKGHNPDDINKKWDYYPGDNRFVWEYFPDDPEGVENRKTGEEKYATFLETLALVTKPDVTITENATVNGDVYGGGEMGITKGSVDVRINGGEIKNDVYGGGALANTNVSNWDANNNTWATGQDAAGHAIYTAATASTQATTLYKTNVILKGGTIGRNVYGGGLGRKAKAANGTQPAETPIEAKVYGDVLVTLNGTKQVVVEGESSTTTYPDNCVVKGSIFGCNNLNGSPQNTVTVHVYKTQGWEGHNVSAGKADETIAKTGETYELAAVYGGGNLAAYDPVNAKGNDTEKAQTYANVIIEGCDLTSIKQVYGGGNAASAPATKVTINTAYEIDEVFGGGNGFGTLDDGSLNPGANVGFYDYHDVESTYPTKTDRTKGEKGQTFINTYVYGSGEANVNIYGGTIHRVFGGSNTKGNVRVTAVTVLDSQDDQCELALDEAYGGGKSAPMDAEAKLLMACIPKLKAAYGGAQDADIQDNVALTITNGTFDRVFGGNNVSGSIHGTITINIEETGCKPVVIGQLYGGGNQAPYTAPTGEHGPTLNVKSFTSIGEVFGGGYGETAVVTGDPYININVGDGYFTKDSFDGKTKEFSFSEYKRNKDGEGEASFVHDEEGKRIEELKHVSVLLPGHEANKIGAINNVYGGGNAAQVIGNTHVNIGIESYEEVVSVIERKTNVKGLYTRSGSEGNYTYTEVTGSGDVVLAESGTTYYMLVKGVDIRGNVYGGGNAADVTGDTNVVIGKEQ